jgi:membrane associated rhomboid family serine protease
MTRGVQTLLAAVVAVAVLQETVVTAADVQHWLGFSVPALGHHWWTLVTYPLVPGDAWSFALALFTLWTFGPRLEEQWGTRATVQFLVACALGGWFAHVTFVGGDATMVGASGLALGVLFAFARRWPDASLVVAGVGSVTVRWVTIACSIALALAAVSGAGSDAPGVLLAQLGALAAAWLYLRVATSLSLSRLKQGLAPVQDEPDEMPRAVPRSMPRGRPREPETIDDVVARSNATPPTRRPRAARPASPSQTQTQSPPDATALDRILDKISAEGIDRLTREERQLLDDESRRRRGS